MRRDHRLSWQLKVHAYGYSLKFNSGLQLEVYGHNPDWNSHMSKGPTKDMKKLTRFLIHFFIY